MRMINFLNKQDRIGIQSTCPKPASISSLLYNKSSILLEFVSHDIQIFYVKLKKKYYYNICIFIRSKNDNFQISEHVICFSLLSN